MVVRQQGTARARMIVVVDGGLRAIRIEVATGIQIARHRPVREDAGAEIVRGVRHCRFGLRAHDDMNVFLDPGVVLHQTLLQKIAALLFRERGGHLRDRPIRLRFAVAPRNRVAASDCINIRMRGEALEARAHRNCHGRRCGPSGFLTRRVRLHEIKHGISPEAQQSKRTRTIAERRVRILRLVRLGVDGSSSIEQVYLGASACSCRLARVEDVESYNFFGRHEYDCGRELFRCKPRLYGGWIIAPNQSRCHFRVRRIGFSINRKMKPEARGRFDTDLSFGEFQYERASRYADTFQNDRYTTSPKRIVESCERANRTAGTVVDYNRLDFGGVTCAESYKSTDDPRYDCGFTHLEAPSAR